jgi:hypothetical protein
MLLTQLPAAPDIVFVPPPEELLELEEEMLEELSPISQFLHRHYRMFLSLL